ncbi:hypothetical protein V474_02510 [Novosphingobium barchaimii LL02]|uniref:Uncharacterized protein n=1 Tax=Novosphingobium barchaimii LL02 TaxID=1114963 RepID=A0A0J7XJQ0_9SPHN|nr:hypothetical protein V474_02510 [Novosphingobium barchaimii LL02]
MILIDGDRIEAHSCFDQPTSTVIDGGSKRRISGLKCLGPWTLRYCQPRQHSKLVIAQIAGISIVYYEPTLPSQITQPTECAVLIGAAQRVSFTTEHG